MKVHINLNDKLALSIPEACALAGVKRDFLYREINAGRLKTAKIKGRRLVRRQALEQWLADQETATDEAMGFKDAVQWTQNEKAPLAAELILKQRTR